VNDSEPCSLYIGVYDLTTYECSEESQIIYGDFRENVVNCKELIVYGNIRINGLIVVDRLVLIGGGYINLVTCREAVFVSYGRPLIINNLYCEKTFIVGGRYPVIIRNCSCVELCCCKCFLNKVRARNMIVGSRCGVRELMDCKQIVFNDPYCWVEKWGCGEAYIRYNYKLNATIDE